MVKCAYPDCDGELEPGAAFCDECGRSQNAAQVAAALAGAAARTLAPPLPTATVPNLRAAVVPRVPIPQDGPSRSITLPLAIGFGLIFTLLFVGCVAAIAIQIALSPLVPAPNRPVLLASPSVVQAAPVVIHTPTAARGRRTVTVVPSPSVVSSPTVPR